MISLVCSFFKFIYLYLYLFLAVLGLRFCARAFSSCSKRGPLFIVVRRPLTIVSSLVGSTGSRYAGSVVVAHGPSGSAACGIFPDQGSNPCSLHWQAGSQPLRHQGSPSLVCFKIYFKHYFKNYMSRYIGIFHIFCICVSLDNKFYKK